MPSPRWRVFWFVMSPLAIALAGYGYLYWSFWSNTPKIKRNFVAELNEPIAAIPEAERAWPRYREPLTKLQPVFRFWNEPRHYRPDSSQRPKIEKAVERHQAALAAIREASKLPHLGYLLSDGVPPEDAKVTGHPPRAGTDNPKLSSTMLTPHVELMKAVRLLVVDLEMKAADGNAQAVVENLLSLLRIAGQLRETLSPVAMHKSWELFDRTHQELLQLLHDYPALLTVEQLMELDRELVNILGENVVPQFAWYRVHLEDIEQREFTDEGHGDGYLFADEDAQIDWLTRILLPISKDRLNRFAESRREYRETLNEWCKLVDQDFAMPPWKLNRLLADELLVNLEGDQRPTQIERVLPFYIETYYRAHVVMLSRDAVRLAIALTLYHRAKNEWPESLESLSPDFLATLPIDPFCGEPLRCRLQDGFPLLYSVGFDHDDDLGKPMLQLARAQLVDSWVAAFVVHSRLLAGDLVLWPESAAKTTSKDSLQALIEGGLINSEGEIDYDKAVRSK